MGALGPRGYPYYYKHGLGGSPTYSSWRALKSRCLNPKHGSYASYAPYWYAPWLDFEVFLRDMGFRPPGTSLDRIDNSLGYSPENCRWATPTVQQRMSAAASSLSFRAARAQKVPLTVLAVKYGVSISSISMVANGKIWK